MISFAEIDQDHRLNNLKKGWLQSETVTWTTEEDKDNLVASCPSDSTLSKEKIE